MKTLLKIALFCLIFCGICQLGFGQVDSTNLSPDFLKGYQYLDSSFFKNITFLESKISASRKISKIRNNKTGEILTLIEEFPKLEGVSLPNLLHKNTKYPKEAMKKMISGTVRAKYTINEVGEVTDIEIIEGVHESLDNQAIKELQSMPKWTPAKINGKTASVRLNTTFNFRIM